MANVTVVYWSGTGNTEAMANAIAAAAGCDAVSCEAFSPETVDAFTAIAFGCPSMGAEELEDTVFLPMFEAVKPKLSGKKIALFGSYGWGDGEWMRKWAQECQDCGAVLLADPVICCEAPDAEALAACEALGNAMID